MGARIRVVGHRGATARAPENTIASLSRGVLDGADEVEFDVQRTKDGVAVLMHDDTLDRTTSGRGPLRERTLSEVRDLDAGSHFAPEFSGERVPPSRRCARVGCSSAQSSTRSTIRPSRGCAPSRPTRVRHCSTPGRTSSIPWRSRGRCPGSSPSTFGGTGSRVSSAGRRTRRACASTRMASRSRSSGRWSFAWQTSASTRFPPTIRARS
ncbi:MAG: hypothetical protein E6J09_02970 [Chloroflexi bacterium]|nr:MAG: hypothetical protein E6J09_02970 [Chloroflexota bacterium]